MLAIVNWPLLIETLGIRSGKSLGMTSLNTMGVVGFLRYLKIPLSLLNRLSEAETASAKD